MRKKAAISVFSWLGFLALGSVLIAACSGSSDTTSGGSSGAAGSGTAGGMSGSGVSGSGTSGSGVSGSGTSGGGMSGEAGGGSEEGGAASGGCGGKTCGVGQICCGPAECGRCISTLSGQACPNMCPTGEGGGGGMPDCAQLLDAVTKAQAAAQACNPAAAKPAAECAGSFDGLCCPIAVEAASATAPDNVAYLSALKAYKASCAHPCPRIACLEPMVGNCKASAAGNKCVP